MNGNRITKSFLLGAAVTAGLGIYSSTMAMAGGMETYKPAAAMEERVRRCEFSANVALTTDYVFRGFSQTDESAAIQGGFDATCGVFHAGIWASNLDFGGETTLNGEIVDVADIEIDYYFGITKEHRGITFDLGAIYYHYPNAFDSVSLVNGALGELDYSEIKFGISKTILRDVTVSTTLFFSPEYTGAVGENWVLETTVEKPLGRGFALSGTVGNQWGDENDGGTDYVYWNAGISKELHEKFTIDLR